MAHADEENPSASSPRVVKGDQNFTLDREAFRDRFYQRFNDPCTTTSRLSSRRCSR